MDTLAASIGDPLVLDPDYSLPSPVHADPLIEVHSITIHPYDENNSYDIWGLIYVIGQNDRRRKNKLYNRSLDNPETITAGSNYLSLTDPTRGPISMVGTPTIVIKLKCRHSPMAQGGSRNAWFAQERVILDTSTHLCFEEPKSLTLQGSLGVVRVNYFVLPCACIAHVQITLTKERGLGPDPPPDIGSPDVLVSGNILASHGINSESFAGDFHLPNFILHYKRQKDLDTVAYEVPIKLSSRSFVCIPAYSSLKLILDLAFSFEYFGREIRHMYFSRVHQSTEFKTCDGRYQQKYFFADKAWLEVTVNFFTSDHPLFLETINIRPESPPSAFRNEPPEMSLWGRDRIEVLSVFVSHDSQKMDDLYGIIGVKFSKSSYHIFGRDEKHPDNLSHCGKALSLKGLTTERSDWFCLCLRLKGRSGLVDIHNYLHIYYYHYDLKRQWFNRPLCSVVFGKQGFAVVHYIIFENAVKATLKISVVAKKVSDSLLVVYGALVAQYSSYEYATTFQKNYWRSVLFEEPQDKDARQRSEDGEIPLFKNVVSVSMGSNLVIDVDLHASVRPSAGATSDDGDDDDDDSGVCNEEEHFKCFVELEFGDFGCKKLTGEYYDVLFSTKWAKQ